MRLNRLIHGYAAEWNRQSDRFVQSGRRVKLIDILSYKRRIDEARMKVLEELVAEAQELILEY
jgi:hypothetical protein